MSTVYVLEPPTKGKVILTTSYGAIDIELWPKEAPKAARNFVQLCLEGYYNDTVFHRIIKSFLVTGDSIYNLLQLGEVETGKDDRPLDPLPKILSVEVLWNPFDDIVPRTIPAKALPTSEKKETKQKVTKKLNLLSFGEEAEEEEKEIAAVNARIKSSHDVLNDPRLLKEEGHEIDLKSDEVQKRKDAQSTVREALSSKREHRKETETGFSESREYSDEDEASFDARMRQQILKRRTELGDLPPKKDLPIAHILRGQSAYVQGTRLNLHQDLSQKKFTVKMLDSTVVDRSDVDNHDERPKKDKLSLKRKGIGSEARAERTANADADLQLLGAAERERQLKKQKKRRRQGQEDEALAKLEKFKSSFFSKIDKSNGEPAGGNNDDASHWTQNTLKFAPELGKNNMSRSNDPNDYVVHDPLLEKGKEKFNKMQAKEKRRQREWAGKSLT
ncbi:hypothetical protein BUALT_Bualt10G0127400 [Buddleja alternifolia]|uniref:PPIase cyclophilin-type domain-containing protein n=1 Tax=Buddleja alternifolia TaxID=168488 RepID=A0AAV6WYZ0_9LAMI|nr:hypothetical protein BUALT_Bualt10G0127400 [Buddleja alternifolia]